MIDVARLGLELDTDPFRQKAEQAGQSLDKIGQRADAMGSALDRAMELAKQGAEMLGISVAAIGSARWVSQTIELAARYETLGVVMRSVGERAKYTAMEMNDVTSALQRQGITMKESRQAVIDFVQSHMELANASKLAMVAQNAAVTAGLNSSETFHRMTDAITEGNSEVLRNIGLEVEWERAYSRMALEVNKTVDTLSMHEKQQARVNAVLEAGVAISGAYDSAMDTASKQMRSTERYVEDLRIKLGTLFLPEYTAGVFGYAHALHFLSENVNSVLGVIATLGAAGVGRLFAPIVGGLADMATKAAETVRGSAMARDAMATQATAAVSAAEAQAKLAADQLAAEKTAYDAAKAQAALAGAEDTTTVSSEALLAAQQAVFTATSQLALAEEGATAGALELAAAQRGLTLSSAAAAGASGALNKALGFLGGPVGVAITAIGAALYFTAQRGTESAGVMEKYKDQLKDMEKSATDTAVGFERLGRARSDAFASKQQIDDLKAIQQTREELRGLQDDLKSNMWNDSGAAQREAGGMFAFAKMQVTDRPYYARLQQATDRYTDTGDAKEFQDALSQLQADRPEHAALIDGLKQQARMVELLTDKLTGMNAAYSASSSVLSAIGSVGTAWMHRAPDSVESPFGRQTNLAASLYPREFSSGEPPVDPVTAPFEREQAERQENERRLAEASRRGWGSYHSEKIRQDAIRAAQQQWEKIVEARANDPKANQRDSHFVTFGDKSLGAALASNNAAEVMEASKLFATSRATVLQQEKTGLESVQTTSFHEKVQSAINELPTRVVEGIEATKKLTDMLAAIRRGPEEAVRVTREQAMNAAVSDDPRVRNELRASHRGQYDAIREAAGKQFDLQKENDDAKALQQSLYEVADATQAMIAAAGGPVAERQMSNYLAQEKLRREHAGESAEAVQKLVDALKQQQTLADMADANRATFQITRQTSDLQAEAMALRQGVAAYQEYNIQQRIRAEMEAHPAMDRRLVESNVRQQANAQLEVDALKQRVDALKNAMASIRQNLIQGLQSDVTNFFDTLFTSGKDAFAKLFDGIRTLFNKMISDLIAAKLMEKLALPLQDALNKMLGQTSAPNAGTAAAASGVAGAIVPTTRPSSMQKYGMLAGAAIGGGVAGYEAGTQQNGFGMASSVAGAAMMGAATAGVPGAIVAGGVALVGAVAGWMKATHDAAVQIEVNRKAFAKSLMEFTDAANLMNTSWDQQVKALRKQKQDLVSEAESSYAGVEKISKKFHLTAQAILNTSDADLVKMGKTMGFLQHDISAFISSLDQIREDAAKQQAQMQKQFRLSVEEWYNSVTGQGYQNQLLEAKKQFDEMMHSITDLFGTIKDSPEAINEATRAQQAYNAAVAQIQRQQEQAIQSEKGDLTVRTLEAQGRTVEANQRRLLLQQQQEMNAAMEKWATTNPEIIDQLRTVQDLERQRAAQQLAETLANAPSGFKVERYRYDATAAQGDPYANLYAPTNRPSDPYSTPVPNATDAHGGQIGSVTIENIIVQADQHTDAVQLTDNLIAEVRKRAFVKFGTTAKASEVLNK